MPGVIEGDVLVPVAVVAKVPAMPSWPASVLPVASAIVRLPAPAEPSVICNAPPLSDAERLSDLPVESAALLMS